MQWEKDGLKGILCGCVHSHMNHMVFALVLIYARLMLKENELKRESACVMCSPSHQIDDVYTVFHRLTFITVFHHYSQPHSVFSKLCMCLCKRERERHQENVCEEEKVCVAVYVDGTSYSSVCPYFDTVQARCKTRANKDSTLFERGGSLCSLVSMLSEGFCLEENREYFECPECFPIPPEAAWLSACV